MIIWDNNYTKDDKEKKAPIWYHETTTTRELHMKQWKK
jgi:hypothetical protein